LIAIDANTVLLTYAGEGEDGYLKTFNIPADGSTITEKIILEHDPSKGQFNSVVQVDFDTYAFAYWNINSYGVIKTFDYSLTAATMNPRKSTEPNAADNSNNAVTMNEAVYNATGGSGNLDASDFAMALSGGAATLGSSTPTSISKSGNVYTLGMNISGTPTGYEQITVTPVDNSIYDATDNEASTSQLMNQAYLHDKVGPTITGTGWLPEDNSTIAVSFSDPVYNTSGGSGALETSDFALSISGGVATLSSATPTSIAVSGAIYTLGIGLSGIPNGTETLTITPVANSIYDGAGLVASTSQSNNTATLNDRRMSIKETLEHELVYGDLNSLVRMNLNTYLLAYRGTSYYGYLSTFTIDADGSNITEVASLQFTGNSTMNYPSVIQMTEDTYIVAYYGYDSGTDHSGTAITNQNGQWISTFRVKPDGSVITKLGSLRHDANTHSNPYNSLVKVDDDTYALAYTGYN